MKGHESPRPEVIQKKSMLNSAEHEISTAHQH